MKIINKTGKPIIVFIQAEPGFDERKEILEPGELSDDFLHFEQGDVIEIKFPEEKKRRK